MPQSHWKDYPAIWDRIGPPLRPNADVAAAFAQAIAGHDDHVLLLGVTRELAHLGQRLTAVDNNEAMIASVWPGNDARRRAVSGNWDALKFEKESFTAVIGDGAANFPQYPEGLRAFFAEMARVTMQGGVLALRVFARPEYPEAIGEIHEHVMRRGIASFHAFKWRLAMAVVSREGDANIAVTAIRDNFNRMFYDRGALAEATGWPMADINTIDAYKDSPDVYTFPTIGQFKSQIPDSFRAIRTMDSGSYELADRCPLLVMERV
ncbi:MAG TPA: class I SAM-dependent methyltransferase [Rhizomicrobium sp.]|nr:class I SAM-dependent methyltransferase [Rhizomicrobium sp.]